MPKEIRTCKVCGKEFEEWPSQIKSTCSKKCKAENISNIAKGKPKSDTHRKNISDALKSSDKAKKHWFKKGALNPAYGRDQTGAANYNWKGGVTNTNQKRRNDPRLVEWRKAVFERDGFICQDCGATGYLQAHHIIPFSKDFSKAFDIDNGRTVCVSCHEKIHGKFIGKFKQSS